MNKKTAVSMRTRQKIKEAFLELYAKKPITDITVGAIMQLAGYNRSTFYNYYDTAQDLLNEIEEEIIERVRKNSQRIFLDDQANINDVFSQIFSTFEQYGDTVYILLGNNGDAAFRLRVKETAKEVFRKITKVQIDAEKLEYVFSFAVSAALGLIEHWHATGKKYSTEEFLRFAKAAYQQWDCGCSY